MREQEKKKARLSVCVHMRFKYGVRPVNMQVFLRFKNGPFLPLLFVTFVFELVESYTRLHVKTSIRFFRIIRTTRTTYDTRYRDHVPGIYSISSQQVPRSYCCTKRVMPLESSHGHHLPIRAASVRAARGRWCGPKRAATAPGWGARSASPEHRVGSLLIVGQDQTRAHSSSC